MKKEKLFSLFYILPIVIVTVFLFVFPLLYSVYISFTNLSLLHFLTYSYVGLRNYLIIFQYGYFLELLKNTLIWTIGSLLTMMSLGFVLALILNQTDLKGRSIFYAILILPWAFPGFISILIWQGLWVDPYGMMNRLILPLLHLPKVNSLTSTTDAWIELIATNDWLSFPYFMTVFYSALQSIPRELYDIADLDGANAFTKFLTITLPSLKRTIAFVFITSFVFTWNNFYPIYVLTGGGPGISTETFIVYAYQEAFSYNNFALAAAWSIISTIFVIVLGIIVIKYTRILDSFT
ncbi:sugar ABC transporter permease [Saccharolobus solfataricus]|nr:sugar ABC transporter permease [Saccharolobus solfataricus]AKA75112.1 sugar ABC transporter permease [Saccharolobus solfataricus]AKA77806.1 sugar ABC transporter permease [Saccharolobus solfataricus]AKA80500.1 sugar ABC transporter permease [Saccharolobus solfataricus]AZF69559.1 sugar ABC transporter permease [Saccharolobus solfataricus]AZF72179.1 sugar ABC transporter permease [Saccharolobus solfataricus]